MYLTDKEILLEYDKNFFIGSLQWKNEDLDYDDLKLFMPKGGMCSVVDKETMELLFVCDNGQDVLKISLEEISSIGARYTFDITHPESVKKVFPEFKHYYNFGDHHRPFVRFQKQKSHLDTSYFLTRTTKLVNTKRKAFINMHNIVSEIKSPESITLYVDKELEFAHQNYHKFYRLTGFEKRVLTLLGDGFRPKDIADKLNMRYENTRKYIKSINNKLELVGFNRNKASIYTKYVIYFKLI